MDSGGADGTRSARKAALAQHIKVWMNTSETPRLNARAAYGRLWRDWLSSHWPLLIVALGLMVVVAVATAGYAKFMEWVIAALENGEFSVIWWGPLGVVVLTVTKGVGHYLQQVVQNKLTPKVNQGRATFSVPPFRYHTMVILRLKNDK